MKISKSTMWRDMTYSDFFYYYVLFIVFISLIAVIVCHKKIALIKLNTKVANFKKKLIKDYIIYYNIIYIPTVEIYTIFTY